MKGIKWVLAHTAGYWPVFRSKGGFYELGGSYSTPLTPPPPCWVHRSVAGIINTGHTKVWRENRIAVEI